MITCLVADTMHESLFPMLEGLGIQYHYNPEIRRDEIKAMLPELDGIIIRSKTRIDADLLAGSGRLKFVARAGAGIDNLDEEVLKQRGIEIINAPEGNRNAVGEQTLGMLLALMNNLMKADREVRGFTWDREGNRGYELAGKTVGIIGYGNMGMTFARKLSGMECNVLAYDKYKENYADRFCTISGMDRIFEEADVVSLHIPLTEETNGMVNDVFLDSFVKPVYLLNTARGEIVSLSAVLNGLQTGKLRGAALDVLENEKLNTLTREQKETLEALARRDDVLLSPHVGGWTFESYVRINEVLTAKLAEILPGLS
ncbi:NAD(P)-dependent oxidoreductase [Fulvivirga sedimenti]|uniref:Phosphoglycerate dehydrogenase n=1 Tax=Fulvivirga sedimenti TaxID=2879465 RepID=A0A9X1HKT2_9BACT|nr:NAD(P)-dependent oxidoreductase [Fulvivirga sedimenti]MCA6073830.1 phosphoglycerate dehydrogenase [Fulvivirga sedimenti]